MSKVLVVDDSEYMRELVMQAVELIDLSSDSAVDGKDALEKLNGSSDYDLVITDINMPEMDGLTLIKEIKKKWTDLPIIVLTTESEESTRKQAMLNGANAWITKPFEASAILNLIKELIE